MSIFLWITIGLITLGSIYLSRIGYIINLIVGILFLIIAIYFYFKEKYFLEFLTKTNQVEQDLLFKKVILGEIILVMTALLVGTIALSAVSMRVFVEGFAVFG